jgi:geranylgeranyl pyrophosphate synthase
MVSKRKKDPASKARLLELLTKEGSLEYTQNYLAQMGKEINEYIDSFGGNPFMSETINGVVDVVLGRKP